MAKRLLLYGVFCFVSVSFVQAQCNKEYKVNINEFFTLSSANQGKELFPLNLCKGTKASFSLNNPSSDDLQVSWYRNDTLVDNSQAFETEIAGVYEVKIQNNTCLYKIGQIILRYTENFDVTISTKDVSVCEDGGGYSYLGAYFNTAMTDVKFEWQKDGVEIPGLNGTSINVTTPGVYSVRATAGACSASSYPVTVNIAKNNRINNNIYFEDTGEIITKDTFLLCKGNNYKINSTIYTDWYKDGKYVASGYDFTPTQSGLYFSSRKFNDNCFTDSKPFYLSFDTKISPIDFSTLWLQNLCGTNTITFDHFDFKGNNTVKFYDFSSNQLKYSYSNVNRYFYAEIKKGKYKIELETGVCKTVPSYLDLTNFKLPLYSNDQKIKEKKITLCNNGYIEINVTHTTSDEVSLYKDGVFVEKKQKHLFYESSGFRISKTGKYYIKVFNPSCTENDNLLSDTLEIIAPEPISTKLNISGDACRAKTLVATQYLDVNYYWYKDKNIVPDAKSASLSLKNNESGTYYAVLKKGVCTVATQSVTFKSQILNQITGYTTICQDSKLELESTLKDFPVLWKGPNGFGSNQVIIKIDSIQPQNEGWYFLLTTINGCTFKDSINITVIKKPAVSFSFANTFCLNQDLFIKFKASPGFYTIDYSLFGSEPAAQYVYFSGEFPAITEKYVNLGKILPKGNKEYFNINLNLSSCSFSLTIPPHATTSENCNDVFEFINLKEKYCYKEKITLRFKLPATISKSKKMRIAMEGVEEKFDLGSFSGDSLQLILPVSSRDNMYFIIEDEESKFVAKSKEFSIKGQQTNIYALFGDYNSGFAPATVMQCKDFVTSLKSGIIYSNQNSQWRINGIDIPGATKPDFEAKESGSYTIALIEEGCVVESPAIEIKNGVPKPEIISLIISKNICVGTTVPLLERRTFPYTSFEWQRNGQTLEKKANRDAFNAAETGYYMLTAYQGTCKANSDSIFIEVSKDLANTISVLGNITIENNKVAVCDKTPAIFQNNEYYFYSLAGESDTVLAKKYGFSFQWKRNGKNIEGANYKSYSSSEPGTYYLQVRQGDCIANSNSVEVVRQNTSSVKLSNNYNYKFLNSGDTLIACSGTVFDIYAYRHYGEMPNWNRELYKDGKLINARHFGDNNTSSYFSIKESGKYSIKLFPENEKNCTVYTDTANILFVDRHFNLPIDTVVSCTDSVSFYAPSFPGGLNSYQWSFKNTNIGYDNFYLKVPFEEGLYIAEIKQTDKCTAIQPILVERKLKSSIAPLTNAPVNSVITLCEKKDNELAVFEISGIYSDNGIYPKFQIEWYRNQQKLPDASYTTNANQSGEYFSILKVNECEAKSNTIKVDIPEIKNQISPSIDSLGICINGSFQILEASKEIGYTYEWFKDNTALEEASSTLKANQPGTYKALIQSGECSALTPKVKLYANNQLPTATIAGDTTLNIGDTANLKLSFTSSPPFSYVLSNNQEGTSDKNTIIHPVKIEESTIFKLTSVKNACGEGTVSGEAKIQVIILANEPFIGHKIIVAPVPAENYCELIFDLPVSQEVSYQVLDMKGQQLSEKNLGKVMYKKQYLNLNQLIAGEYLIRIQVGKDFVTRKLIKF